MEDNEKIMLFEKASIPSAVAKLSVPMIFSSLVMVLYNMADTYFVGMLNNPVENAAVSLAAPVLLAFNAINNLFGVGTSSMMSRAAKTTILSPRVPLLDFTVLSFAVFCLEFFAGCFTIHCFH